MNSFLAKLVDLEKFLLFACGPGRPLSQASLAKLRELGKGTVCSRKTKDGRTVYYRTEKGKRLQKQKKAKRQKERERLKKLREKVQKRKEKGTYIGRRVKPKAKKGKEEKKVEKAKGKKLYAESRPDLEGWSKTENLSKLREIYDKGEFVQGWYKKGELYKLGNKHYFILEDSEGTPRALFWTSSPVEVMKPRERLRVSRKAEDVRASWDEPERIQYFKVIKKELVYPDGKVISGGATIDRISKAEYNKMPKGEKIIEKKQKEPKETEEDKERKRQVAGFKSLKFPDLQGEGTELRIANAGRSNIIKEIAANIKESGLPSDPSGKKFYDELVQDLAKQKNAAWWIENRNELEAKAKLLLNYDKKVSPEIIDEIRKKTKKAKNKANAASTAYDVLWDRYQVTYPQFNLLWPIIKERLKK